MFQKLLILAVTLASTLAIAGCNDTHSHTAPATPAAVSLINQKSICQVNSWEAEVVAEACVPGQKVIYLPNRWGNEQLPIMFAAVNCDLQYSVVQSPGAVTCIYNPISINNEPESEAQTPAQATQP